MIIKRITKLAPDSFKLMDLTTERTHTFLLEGGLITHNSMYPTTVMSGGQGPLYSADTVFIITKTQEKDDSGVAGFNFNINIEKSRSVREKSRLTFKVTFKNGINRWSNFWEWALASGNVQEASKGWYQRVDMESGEVLGGKVRRAEIEADDEYWQNLTTDKTFSEYVENRYRLKALEDEDADNYDDGQSNYQDEDE